MAAATCSNARRMSSIFECVSDWVAKQVAEQKTERKQNIYANFLRNDLRVIVNNNVAEQGQPNLSKEELAKIVETLYSHVDGIVEKIEEKTTALLNTMSDDFITSNIIENYPQSLKVFIIILLALKDCKVGNDLLFKEFTEADIIRIVKLHFKNFKIKTIEHDTIRKNYFNPVKNFYYSGDFDETIKKIDELLTVIMKQL